MEVIHSRVCGLDVHKKSITACILIKRKKEIRTFGTMTEDLLELLDWIQENQCPIVAMESTGVYWKPIYNLLEASDIEALVVNAQHIKNVPGRKSDIRDAQWIAQLLQHGLVNGSYIPNREQREFLLSKQLEHIEYLEKQVEAIYKEVAQRLSPSEEDIKLIMTISGVGLRTAEQILAEVGTDMSRFKSDKHLASWAGMVPGENESAGKKK